MGDRIEELDALRGLAALSVVTHHLVLALPPAYGWLQAAPLMNGHEAVLLFFVLSGFVLGAPYVGGVATPAYPTFLVPRVCRIYLPYLAAVTVAAGLAGWLGGGRLPGMGGWFNAVWQTHDAWRAWLVHLNLLGSFDATQLDPVVWSLVVELRVSLVLPLLAWLVARGPWWAALAGALALDRLGAAWLGAGSDPQTGLAATLHFVSFFVAGIVLAKHRARLTRGIQGVGAVALLGLGLLGYYQHVRLVTRLPLLLHLPALPQLDDAVALAGVMGLLVVAQGWQPLRTALRARPLLFLGRVSYSLYLVHALVILTLLHLGAGHLPVPALALAALPLSLAAAYVAWRFVEKPSIDLARGLTRPRPAAAAPEPTLG